MMTFIRLVALLATFAASSPLKARSPFVVKETHPVPRQWSRVGPAPADHIINLQIGLKQSQFDEFERHLYEVSDPFHVRYGKHLTESEVNNLVQPSEESLKAIQDWLRDSGIPSSRLEYTPANDWVKLSLPVNAIENMLDTVFSVFQHENGDFLVRAPTWSLPAHLIEHVSVIQPTTSFFRPKKMGSTLRPVDDVWKSSQHPRPPPNSPPSGSDVAAVCNMSLVTPLCLRTLYGTIDYVPQVPGKNKVGLNDFLAESNNRSDVKLFLETYRPEAASEAYQFDVVVIANGNDEQTQENATELANGKDLEGNLDAETIIAFTTGGSPPFNPDSFTPTDTNEPYLTWLNYVLAMPQSDLPQVISTSYDDDEQTAPYSFATAVCNGFAQLGARGISLFFASGDGGVGGDAVDCLTNDGKNTSTFVAEFPSTCPYITSVGATKFVNPEVVATDAANGFVSGGGFSRYFSRPKYQEAIVAAYVKSLGDKYTGLYNPNGRGYPDIAAQGYHFATIWNGSLLPLDGTSASTPAAAAVISLVNDALLAQGKPVLGFLNPWLYAGGWKAFTDITIGSSAGCGTDGFPAKEGWDAVTGFGTPYFPKIKELVLSNKTAVYP